MISTRAFLCALLFLFLTVGFGVGSEDRHTRGMPQGTRIISVREGTELVAALSPNGRRVAFILLGQTWLVNRAGGRAVALTDVVREPREDGEIAWAPDSRRLAVLSRFGERPGLRVIDVVSRTVTLVTNRRNIFAPAWTPDGRHITLQIVPTSGALEDMPRLWSFPAEGGDAPEQITSLPRRAGTLAYTSDGKSIAYSGPDSHSNEPTSQSDLWERDLTTGTERQLTSDGTLDAYPAYSPDGRWLAFLSERSGTRQVWLLPRAGGKPRPLTPDAEDLYLAPLTWLPDSRGIVYTAAGKIHIAHLDGSPKGLIEFNAELPVKRWQPRRRPKLPPPGAQRRVLGIVTPQLAPDGRQVAFAAVGDLWVMDAKGGVPRRITRTAVDEWYPRWSPDGHRLAYLAAAPGREPECRVLEIERPEKVQVVSIPITVHFAWSPDGRRLAYLHENKVGWVDLASGERHIVAEKPSSMTLVGWDPRGDAIVFATLRQAPGLGPGRNRQHWRARTDGDHVGEWQVPGEYSLRGAWTTDLSRAAYANSGVGYHVGVGQSGPPARISDPSPRFFSWSADGRHLLYLSGARLRLLDVARGVARTLDVALGYQVPPAPPPLLIRGVRIIDGTGAAPSAPRDLLVSRGRILKIAPAGTLRTDRKTRQIDAAGCSLLPGLFNLHYHKDWSRPFMGALVYHGVLALRDPARDAEWTQSQRERMEAGELLAPRLFMTGGLITQEQGRDTTHTRPVDVSDRASVQREIDNVAALGADWIKPYYRNALLDARVIEASHARGLPVTSHFVFLSSLARGLNGKEHAPLYYRSATAIYRDDILSALRAADVLVTPTLVTYSTGELAGHSRVQPLDTMLLDDPAFRVLYPPSVLDAERQRLQQPISEDRMATLRQHFEWDLENVRRLRDAGIRVVTGDDTYAPWGELGVHLEMELLVKAGFTPLEAIRAATFEGARGLGVEAQLGTIAVGKLADFIIVDGNPAVEIRDTRRIQWVVQGGKPYTRPEILGHVRRAAAP